jgi:hypothetical protein
MPVGGDRSADRVRAVIAFCGLRGCAVLLGDQLLDSDGTATRRRGDVRAAAAAGVTRAGCATSQSVRPHGLRTRRGTD